MPPSFRRCSDAGEVFMIVDDAMTKNRTRCARHADDAPCCYDAFIFAMMLSPLLRQHDIFTFQAADDGSLSLLLDERQLDYATLRLISRSRRLTPPPLRRYYGI